MHYLPVPHTSYSSSQTLRTHYLSTHYTYEIKPHLSTNYTYPKHLSPAQAYRWISIQGHMVYAFTIPTSHILRPLELTDVYMRNQEHMVYQSTITYLIHITTTPAHRRMRSQGDMVYPPIGS